MDLTDSSPSTSTLPATPAPAAGPSTAQAIETAVEAILVPLADLAAPMIGGPTLEAIVQLGAKYGPEAVTAIISLFQRKGGVAVQDVLDVFSALKPYSAYGIPDVAPRPAKA
jgi:hypothetical protein